MKNQDAQIILALDVDSLAAAEDLIDKLYPKIRIFKIGSHLFTSYGPKIIEAVHKTGAEVFLDLKYFDIPNTVAQAVKAATRLKVKMLTLHVSGGKEMLEAAVRAALEQAKAMNSVAPLLIGVTILTSQAAQKEEVLQLARIGIAAGLDGLVCSVNEAAYLRQQIEQDFLIVTPGIRDEKSEAFDQKRTSSAKEAQKAGSNFLVIGRPILKAADPVKKTEEFLGDLYGRGN